MFIPLEGQGIVSIRRIIAIVRYDGETAIYLRNGSLLATGFRPETLGKRYNAFRKEARENAAPLRRRTGGNRS
ncbi:MAG: hypothetical protein PHI81_01430 [Synergistaceae bacterium]|jgi:hypothetical protein|nr:hypothetical protein [Synergistaceae bacterium]MDD4021557.1 hypothetical protein [Synergistaceae bacterium]MDD4613539.1 hypothetical protein [Synergistaceae bacterium]NCC58628.1 hypothetical protein [Synergistales bacterium]NLO58390.1 hypothetical protein [Synergistaceae bacterium]